MSVRIDVWADLICPWCYIGKRRLEAALARVSIEAEIVWRAFELDAKAPTPRDLVGDVAYLSKKFRMPAEKAQAMIDNVTKIAAGDGLEYHLDRTRTGNSFDAHRMLAFGREHGVQGDLVERLMRAHFTDGKALDDREVLASLGAEVGLDAGEARAVLAGDRYASGVRADQAKARELGITGVPFYVLAERIGVSGAQPVDVLVSALAQASSS